MFDNGQKASLPIYVPFVENDATLERRAIDVAQKIGRLAAASGEIDPVRWVLSGKIPLRDYLQQSLRSFVAAAPFPNGVQFYCHLKTSVHQADQGTKRHRFLWIPLFNGNELKSRRNYMLIIPPEFASPDLFKFLDRAVDEVLGENARRNTVKSSARPKDGLPPQTLVSSAPRSRLKCSIGKNAVASFVLGPGGESLAFSLGTKDTRVAQSRLARVEAFIAERLRTGEPLTVGDIRQYSAEVCQQSDPTAPRINSSRAGPVIVYLPNSPETSGQAREALRLYTALSGNAQSGFELRVNVVVPNGRGTDIMYSPTFTISPGHGLTLEQAEGLRSAVRKFLNDRLSAFYHAGGQFRDRDDIAFSDSGKPALTPRGVEKFHRILENRFNNVFVEAALNGGVANPFDAAMPAATVRRFGGFSSIPQPAHHSLQLLNPHTIHSQAPQEDQIRGTLVWQNPEGGEQFRQELKFKGMNELTMFVREIDRWTTQSVAKGQPAPPVHAGTEFLKRLCAGLRYGRSSDSP